MQNSNETEIILYLIRHGQTKGNARKCYIGITDEELSDEGKKLVSKKSYPLQSQIYASPMTRCRQTAKLLFPRSEIIIVDELKEMNFGIFEGKNFEMLKDDIQYKEWVDSGCTTDIPQGEKLDDFSTRTRLGLDKVFDDMQGKDIKEAAVVAHGGTIMALLAYYLDKNFYDFWVDNACGYLCRFRVNAGKKTLISYEKITGE